MTDARAMDAGPLPAGWRRAWLGAALLWLAVVLAIAAHQVRFWQDDRLDADLLALLPAAAQAPGVAQATRRLADAVSRQIVVALGAPRWEDAQAAAALWRRELQASGAPLAELRDSDDGATAALVGFYAPWRDRLLTAGQRARLQSEPAPALQQSALAALYRPAAGPWLGDWAADPLALWPQWWSERAGASRARPRDGELWLAADGRDWLVLRYEIAGAALRLDGEARYGAALDAAGAALQAALPQVQRLTAGMPLHAEAAAVQASREINAIGWGSLAAVLLLVWLAFRSLRPLLLVGLSLLIGCAAALSATALAFGQVHLITLVFGASLVGVAEDYGIHYFAARQGHPQAAPQRLLLGLAPGLLIALATSVLAYLALGIAAFPGLRQMALFSAVGLVAALLTVLCWFPLLDRGRVPRSRFADAVAASLAHWPRLRAARGAWVGCGLLALLCAVGLAQLRVSDDLRQLQNAAPERIAQQQRLGRLLGLPSPAQFYVLRGADAEELLQREEQLKARLDPLVGAGRLAGYSALSDWLPSVQRQRADAALTAAVETPLLAGAGSALGEHFRRPAFAPQPLTLEHWLAGPVPTAVRAMWLGEVDGAATSVVLLRGLDDPALLPALAAVADGVPGARWVDRPAELSQLLGRYRAAMGALLLLGHALVFGALWLRYGRTAWRAWLPTVVATAVTLAALAACGQPLQLFTVLALLLLLGVGVDYGIFLLEHRDDGSAWLAVALGAASTWLAFGLLALSGTPALRAFGLTLLIGLAVVSLLAPCFRAPAAEGKPR